MSDNMTGDECCTAGVPPKWWERWVPDFAWGIYWRWRSWREFRAMVEGRGKARRIAELTFLHARRISEADQDRIIDVWRDVLGIREVKTRHAPYAGPYKDEL